MRGGRMRQSCEIALGEARETLANRETAEAIGYIPRIGTDVRTRLDHIIGMLVKLVH